MPPCTPHANISIRSFASERKLTAYGALAEVFSGVLGRAIAYVAITPAQAAQRMEARGMPDWLVAHNVGLAKVGAAGGFSAESIKLIEDVGRADHNQTIRRGFQGTG